RRGFQRNWHRQVGSSRSSLTFHQAIRAIRFDLDVRSSTKSSQSRQERALTGEFEHTEFRRISAARKRHAKVCKPLKLLVAKTSVNIRKRCYFLSFIGFSTAHK